MTSTNEYVKNGNCNETFSLKDLCILSRYRDSSIQPRVKGPYARDLRSNGTTERKDR
jgi:hypothetical protein